MLTAHAATPFNTVQELVAYARANPGKLNYASFGTGTTSHLNGELFKRLAGIDIVHVPYKGSGDAMKDHLTGAVQLFFDGPTTAIANAKTGRVKLVATAAETRKAALPDLPTMREAGYDVGMWGYLWFWGPARHDARDARGAAPAPRARGRASRGEGSVRQGRLRGDGIAAGGNDARVARPQRALGNRHPRAGREAGLMSGPLAGIRVLEFESIGPAPFAGMLLADMGADVLVIDRPATTDLGLKRERWYDVMMRGKRSVTLDLKKSSAAALELVVEGRRADRRHAPRRDGAPRPGPGRRARRATRSWSTAA